MKLWMTENNDQLTNNIVISSEVEKSFVKFVS